MGVRVLLPPFPVNLGRSSGDGDLVVPSAGSIVGDLRTAGVATADDSALEE